MHVFMYVCMYVCRCIYMYMHELFLYTNCTRMYAWDQHFYYLFLGIFQ